ncbi:hypothetical protein [Bombilactobacillus bombi]|uniref:hypothetical protein n=1 Tax=Bombilactobacillus bombi TaxID=1303590 RepID=UPI0015E60AFA|nr:hypothetical protein [Bombilactobacillus bombi]MBA1434637.1 hypothetical protein [Bombilactobacillus bombi]
MQKQQKYFFRMLIFSSWLLQLMILVFLKDNLTSVLPMAFSFTGRVIYAIKLAQPPLEADIMLITVFYLPVIGGAGITSWLKDQAFMFQQLILDLLQLFEFWFLLISWITMLYLLQLGNMASTLMLIVNLFFIVWAVVKIIHTYRLMH